MSRIDLTYRHFRILAAVLGGKPTALVWNGRTRLAEHHGATLDAAVEAAKVWVDQQVGSEKAARREAYVATKSEYVRALQAVFMGDHQVSMLRAHANAPDRALSATQLAAAAGYDSFEVSNAQYGALGRKIAEFLSLQPPIHPQRGQRVWTMALADEGKTLDEFGHFRWTMHPELAEALRELNMA